MYEFNKEKHIHTLDGKPLIGVTTALGVVSATAPLMNWAVSEALKVVEQSWSSGLLQSSIRSDLDIVLKNAKSAHVRKRDKAGDIGTLAHSMIEEYIKIGNTQDRGDSMVKTMVKNFIDWSNDNKIEFLESEKHVYSRELWIGGICDFVCKIDNKIYIGDVKTSSGIYPEYFWQTSAYQYCLDEMGLYKEIEGHIIVNCKKDGKFNTEKSYGYIDNIEAFKACLTIYKTQQKLKNVL